MTNKTQMAKTKFKIILLSIIVCILSFSIISAVHAAGEDAQNYNIPYIGGSQNLKVYLPDDFRNATFEDDGDLFLFGSSIEVVSLDNLKFVQNIEQTITILEYIDNSIGFKKAIEDPDKLFSVKIYDTIQDKYFIELESKGTKDSDLDHYGGTTEAGDNPILGEILGNSNYISPTLIPSEINVKKLEEAIKDLKEHLPEGTITNIIFDLTRLNLIIVEIMSVFFLIFGGIIWLTSGGNDTQIQKGKNIIIWSVVGIIGGLISYAVINIVIQLFT